MNLDFKDFMKAARTAMEHRRRMDLMTKLYGVATDGSISIEGTSSDGKTRTSLSDAVGSTTAENSGLLDTHSE